MHLFSTHSWHIVHCDPVIYLLCFQSFYRLLFTGVELWGLVFLILVFPLQSLLFFCIVTTLVSLTISLSLSYHLTQLVPNFTCTLSFVGRVMLIGKYFSELRYCSRKRNSQITLQDQVTATRVRAGLGLGPCTRSDKSCHRFLFSHGPMLDHKASVAPEPDIFWLIKL